MGCLNRSSHCVLLLWKIPLGNLSYTFTTRKEIPVHSILSNNHNSHLTNIFHPPIFISDIHIAHRIKYFLYWNYVFVVIAFQIKIDTCWLPQCRIHCQINCLTMKRRAARGALREIIIFLLSQITCTPDDDEFGSNGIHCLRLNWD